MRGRWQVLLAAGLLMAGVTGCVTLPERVEVNVGGKERPEPVDSSRVPQPATLEESHQELVRAYQNLQYYERENARLEEKAAKYKRQRDECKKRLDKYED
jgi:predicted nuclease with TOPRIM domain